jgi:hypothetical protein
VESSCEFGTEPSGSIKFWKTIECPNNCGSLSSIELVSWLGSGLFFYIYVHLAARGRIVVVKALRGEFFNVPNPSGHTRPWGSLSP